MKKNWLGMLGMVSICTMLAACGSQHSTENITKEKEKDVSVQEEVQKHDESDEKKEEKEVKETLESVETVIQTTSIENFHVSYLDDGTISLGSYSGSGQQVVIPNEVEGKMVTVIQADTFANHEEILKVVIPDSVIEIGDNAFTNCSNIESVKLGTGIKKIGSYAFGMNLKTLDLPEGLEEIGRAAFSGLSDLEELNIPSSLNEINRGVFLGCGIESLVIPGNIKKIGVQAFCKCQNLKSVELKEGVEIIKEGAFEKCELLESVIIPSSVNTIEEYAFYDCPNVTIYTSAGSYAETWALENNVPCVTQ